MVQHGVVHNCTIFLLPLDVRNIVQGGDPLYAAVNYKQGCGGCIWPKWVRFLAKNSCLLCWGAKFLFFRTQKFHIWGPGRSFFRPFHLFKIYWVFSKFTESDSANWSHQWLDQWENLIKLLSNSVNLEGPLLEPARSHQIKSIIEKAFKIYWVTQ